MLHFIPSCFSREFDAAARPNLFVPLMQQSGIAVDSVRETMYCVSRSSAEMLRMRARNDFIGFSPCILAGLLRFWCWLWLRCDVHAFVDRIFCCCCWAACILLTMNRIILHSILVHFVRGSPLPQHGKNVYFG